MNVDITIVMHYHKEDKDFMSDCGNVDIIVNGLKAKTYGDWYHDKGEEKAQGFIDAFKFIHGEESVFVTNKKIADEDW